MEREKEYGCIKKTEKPDGIMEKSVLSADSRCDMGICIYRIEHRA